jgi:NitT/TauT family transport system substrate-binding protein
MKNYISFLLVLFILSGMIIAYRTLIKKEVETVKVTIGYQSPTSQTWGALILKNQKLVEKYYEKNTGGKKIEVTWLDYPSGSPITSAMIAGKIDIGFMGDMPLLLNAAKGQAEPNYKSVFLAFDGKGKNGKNQAILVNKESDISSVNLLTGKTISVPFASSAHRMLLAILEKNNLVDKVNLINQDVTTAMTSLESEKVDAVATWDPYPRLFEKRGKAKKLADGSKSETDYLAGVVASRTWAEQNSEITIAFLQALNEAHQLTKSNPAQAATIFATESGFTFEICLEEAKEIRWETLLYKQDFSTMEQNLNFLKKLGKITDVNLTGFFSNDWLKKSYEKTNVSFPSISELEAQW